MPTHPYGEYFDPTPSRALDTPVFLCGFFGTGAPHIGKCIAALAGWPYIDIYENTAHRLEQHRALRGVGFENPDWGAAEEDEILRALARRPCSVVGLPDGHLPTAHVIESLCRRARIVVVKRAWLDLQEAAIWAVEQAPERHPEFIEQPIPDLQTLQALYRTRVPLYARAHETVDATNRSPGVVARALVRRLF